MQPFTQVTGAAAPLMQANVDTDVIIRIERLTGANAKGLGDYAFEVLRYRPDGSDDPNFVLNQSRYRNAPILLVGPNFGTGSSREPAVWALQGLGVRCVIGSSFGDIFFANCFQNGVLPIRLAAGQVEALAKAAQDSDAPFTVDLEAVRITAPGGLELPFEIDALKRTALLGGLDDIGVTLAQDDEITAWQAADRAARPWVWNIQDKRISA